jgi:hypothetical protein
MNADELKAACDKAGIAWRDEESALMYGTYHGPLCKSGVLHWDSEEARAYVAERLVGMVLVLEPEVWCNYEIALTEVMEPNNDTLDVLFGTAEQRIRAAMAVLP